MNACNAYQFQHCFGNCIYGCTNIRRVHWPLPANIVNSADTMAWSANVRADTPWTAAIILICHRKSIIFTNLHIHHKIHTLHAVAYYLSAHRAKYVVLTYVNYMFLIEFSLIIGTSTFEIIIIIIIIIWCKRTSLFQCNAMTNLFNQIKMCYMYRYVYEYYNVTIYVIW